MPYIGGKSQSGVYQRIINLIPPHDVYIEPFLGSGAILRMKRPAPLSIGVDRTLSKVTLSDRQNAQLVEGCGIEFLENFDFRGGEFVYCDPPYVLSTRGNRRYYRHEMTDADHERLLSVIVRLPCPVLISGYASTAYDTMLAHWNREEFEVMTRGHTWATEVLWFNYDRPARLHDVSYVRKVVTKCKWQRFRDVTPRSFLAWRKTFAKLRAAKTVKEYQVSVEAWLNWLAENEYIERNPLSKVKYPETRGNAVRKSRDLTIPELRALLTTAPTVRALAYETLVYTGQRCCEIASLRRAQLDLGERPCIRLYDDQTKDLDNRTIPLYPPLAERLRAAFPADMAPDALAFPDFPTLEQFYVDIKFAGIERKDASGRVVNMHALRKTFQTMSVNAGVNQRATQAILGHADANTTANIYTHVPSLGLDAEIKKLPRWEEGKEVSSGAVTKKDKNDLILEQLHGLAELIKSIDSKELNVETTAATLAARHGFEP